MRLRVFIAMIAASLLLAPHAYAAPGKSAPMIERRQLPRADGKKTPVKLYGDWNTTCKPTVILSHGVFGNEDSLDYLAGFLVPLGYRVALMQHRETDATRLEWPPYKRKIMAAVARPENHEARMLDLEAVWLISQRPCQPKFMVLGGHSMGAATTMLAAGARGRFYSKVYDKFDAYIAISPQGVGWMHDAGAWDAVKKPVLMIIGTKDDSLDGDYLTRVSAFEGMPANRNVRLVLIPGANHLHLGGGPGNEKAQQLAGLAAVEFLDMVKRGAWEPTKLKGVEVQDK